MCVQYDIVRDQGNNRIVRLWTISDFWLVYKNKVKKSAYSWMLTWPHTSSPNPINTHHIHWSSCRGEQLNGFPPNWTITIYKEKQRRKGVNIFWGKNKTRHSPQKKPKPHKKTPNNFQSYFTWDFTLSFYILQLCWFDSNIFYQ